MMKNFFYMILLLTFILNIGSCKWFGGDDDKEKLEAVKEALKEKDQIFYSANDSGKWNDLAKDHIPQCTLSYTKDKKYRLINVTVPLKGSRETTHYIEAILLLDHNNNELQKKEFSRGTKDFSAVFKLPKDYKSYVYVVSKCNQHDMWKAKVFPGSR